MQKVEINPLCSRVVVNELGLSLRPSDAFFERNICARIIFVRSDGWSLGAPPEFEQVAYEQWPDCWTHFRVFPDFERLPICEYRNKVRKG